MKRLITIVAAFLLASVFYAPPAHAVETNIDSDSFELDAANGNAQFKGKVVSFHDSANGRIRARLTGDFFGRGTLRARWFFSDGTNQVNSKSTAGVNVAINFTSSSIRDVVRFTFTFERNAGGTDTESLFVGDSPDSQGICDRIDRDTVKATHSSATIFSGVAIWSCEVRAFTGGQLAWDDSLGGAVDRVRVRVSYGFFGGGVVEDVFSRSIGRNEAITIQRSELPSTTARDARSLRLVVQTSTNDGATFSDFAPIAPVSVKLGDL
jgi:hypothetical protein